jgi:hypothetical protein
MYTVSIFGFVKISCLLPVVCCLNARGKSELPWTKGNAANESSGAFIAFLLSDLQHNFYFHPPLWLLFGEQIMFRLYHFS